MSASDTDPVDRRNAAPNVTSAIALGRILLIGVFLGIAISALSSGYVVSANSSAPGNILGLKDTPIFIPIMMVIQAGTIVLLAVATTCVGNVVGACVSKFSGRKWLGTVSGVFVGLVGAMASYLVISPDDLPPIVDGKPVATVGYVYPCVLAAACAFGGLVGVKSSPRRES